MMRMIRPAMIAASVLLATCAFGPSAPPEGMARLIVQCCELLGGTPANPDCRPNPALKNRIPIDLVQSDAGAREVEDALSRFMHGDYI